jgi:Acyclic terpene utilisation family protein AtuA
MGGAAQDKVIRIGGASAFLMDSALAVPQLLRAGGLHYLIFDYLAEGSMGLLGRLQAADPRGGFGSDFLNVHVGPHLQEIARQGIKVIANAGGLNPQGLAAATEAQVKAHGLNLKVAYVDGDDVREQIATLRAAAVRDMFTGAALPERKIISANVYLGAFPIAAALARGADIVITGRVVDSALALGPLIHEFGWGAHDYDKLAAGTLAGHLLECGAQVSGGTFTDWRSVPGWENLGFPIGECRADGSLVITKPSGTGGLVSVATVAEQLLYEVSDPADYIVTDVRCDFSQVQLTQLGTDCVQVSGARGQAPTDTYKVCITYDDGWRAIAYQPLIGEEAAAKGERQAAALFARTRQLLRARELPDFTATACIIIGAERSFGAHAQPGGAREVICKLVVDHPEKLACDLFAREQWTAISGMSVGTSINLATHVMPVTGLFLCLMPKTAVHARLTFEGETRDLPDVAGTPAMIGSAAQVAEPPAPAPAAGAVAVDLVRLAYTRSGDKGHLFNVAVIARRPEYLPWLRAALTRKAVGEWYRHLRAEGAPRVERYEVPGFSALNLVVHDALEGGINASTQLDPAAKGMGQMLLRFPVPVPAALAAGLGRARQAEKPTTEIST